MVGNRLYDVRDDDGDELWRFLAMRHLWSCLVELGVFLFFSLLLYLFLNSILCVPN